MEMSMSVTPQAAPEIVASAADVPDGAMPPLLVLDVVTGFLDEHGIGTGRIEAQRIGDGQSNITYRIRREGADVVLRRGPRPPLPRSAHNMVREARVQQAVAAHDVPVPEVLAICEDESLLGVPFYVMNFLTGDVITDEEPARLANPASRRQLGENMVDALLSLHSIDVSSGPLSELGRPSGYLERQVRTFSSLWGVNSRREIPEVGELAERLGARVPTTQRHSVVHGDYRLGNLMIAASGTPEVSAILDWEMATLGDPLADLGYLVATYSDRGAPDSVMDLSPVTRLEGYPTADELAERYGATSTLDLGDLPWYKALALWKAAIFCEAMYTRYLAGERPGDTFAPKLETGVPELLHRALAALDEG
ncbi:phosphotransferase family protein [Brevibacterium daeguense]|uniref:Phosphotransferase family protein n=2 Tax=Brevibacterium daeguense TaxID=909936 RepID=A0ABP8EFL2_9MICO